KEVQIMRDAKHSSIVELLWATATKEQYILGLEFMDGGELFYQLKNLVYFSEDLSRHVTLQVARGIRHLHRQGVVHRDIKLENVLFNRIPIVPSRSPKQRPAYGDSNKDDEGEFTFGHGGGGIGRVKIADFGLGKAIKDSETRTVCGTVGYMAPEIVKREPYNMDVDVWALGCLFYTILCGFHPFPEDGTDDKVASGSYSFPSPWWDDISASAREVVQHLLCVNRKKRYTMNKFFAHPWCS
ncbi:kinase-like domain-containing protein, partial [Mycena leptocephala]